MCARNARLLRSDDKGLTWTQVYDFGQDHVLSIVVASDSVIIAALCNQGILRSADNGKTWMRSGLRTDKYCEDLLLTSNNAGDIYAGAWGRYGPGFYHSTDAGKSWIMMPISGTRWMSISGANFQYRIATNKKRRCRCYFFRAMGGRSLPI